MSAPRPYIKPGDTQALLEAAFTAARGDSRTALALLHGAFVELSIRIAIEEQPTARHIAAAHAFLQQGAAVLHRTAAHWAPLRAPAAIAEGEGATALGRLHDAQGQGAQHASALRAQLETRPFTQSPARNGYEYEPDVDPPRDGDSDGDGDGELDALRP